MNETTQGADLQLIAFRIKNFRAITDSGWVPFSPDGITVLVGQNESGKSSVLDALYVALSEDGPTPDDFRIDAPLAEVLLRENRRPQSTLEDLAKLSPVAREALDAYLKKHNDQIEIECGWEWHTSAAGVRTLHPYVQTIDPELDQLLIEAAETSASSPQAQELAELAKASQTPTTLVQSTSFDVAAAIWRQLPLAVLFNEESGYLPDHVDIDENGRPIGAGATAAQNFLSIADIDLPALVASDRRARENILNRANARVSGDFNSFWSQTIGNAERLSLKCEIDNYDAKSGEKAGRPHLTFWVCNGSTQLYPKQRSRGVRWFISFYLQLKASEKAKAHRLFLLDEPGANLHSKAQGDVLHLINKLAKDTSTVVYSTHSPQMLEYSKLFRVHAVQRDGDLDDSPTTIIQAHKLGTASTDTLSPVLTAMGADLSQHQVIRRRNNVLLEEMSGFYYLSAFWKLLDIKQEAHFIAATGVNKIEALANMFRGWGLDFIVVVDDDKQGREALKSMKRELFGDDDKLAGEHLIKLPSGTGIEDAFSAIDFAKHVLQDESLGITVKNSEYLKEHRISKPVIAYKFLLAVEQCRIKIDDLSEQSRKTIFDVVNVIRARLQ